MPETPINIAIQYYALLREQRGCSREILETTANTATDLYKALQAQYGFSLPVNLLKVAINEEFSPLDTPLKDNDEVVFIPPVAGG